MTESVDHLIRRGGWAEDRTLRRRTAPFGPRNTWSSLAYAAVGIGVAWRHPTGEAAVFAVAMGMLATGSALYHSQKTIPANRTDWLGMMAVFGVLAPRGWVPSGPLVAWAMLAAGLVAGTIYLRRSADRPGGRKLHFDRAIGVLLVVGSLHPLLHGGWRGVAISWALFAASYGLWWLDKRRSRWTGLWGHAVWHVGTALALAVLYRSQAP